MKLISRVILCVAVSHSIVFADTPSSGGFFDGVKAFFSKKNVEADVAKPVEEIAESTTAAPSLGVWGTINRFFQSKTGSTETIKTQSATPVKAIASEVEPTPADQVFKENNKSDAVKVDHSSEIASHKAKYIISLEKNFGDDVSDASGEMLINVYDTGDGLVFEQNSSLTIYNGDGEGEQIVTNLATWQNYEGTRYRFTSRTVRNGEEEELIKGEALKDDTSHQTRIKYAKPNESEIVTSFDTVFPLHHLINALKEAKLGKAAVSNVVFDGSSETHEAVSVDTILGAPKKSDLKIKSDKDISTSSVWPMRLAVYAPGSNGPEPDYEMVQNVFDSGVIKDMTLDYGSFQVKATLSEIDFYEAK